MLKKILLFGLITIIISVIMVFAYDDKFPRIGYTPPYRGIDQTYRQFFAQAVDTLHFTALIQNIPHFEDADFYAATSRHLNLVNTNATITFDASSGQYSMYQADRYNDSDYFQPAGDQIRFLSTRLVEDNVGHGRQVHDVTIDPPISNGYAWFVSKDNPNDNRGYVLYGLWNNPNGIDYSREQDRDSNLTYYVIFNLKYPKDSTYSSDDTVARLQVYFYDGDTGDTLTLDQKLLVYDSTIAGQYDTFSLTFNRPIYHPSDFFDYRVYWYKNTDLYIDYVEVYDYNYNLLFNEKACDTCNLTVYEWLIINDTNITHLEENYNGSSLYRWLLFDEPTYDQYKSSRRVNEILDESDYAPGIQATCDFVHRNIYRYVNEVEPKEVFYDEYPILAYKLPQGDNDSLQAVLDAFAGSLWKVNDAAKSKEKEWWYIAQAFSYVNNPLSRYPHNSELKAMVYMALAYGARGIGYFEYASRYYTDGIHGGLVDSITAEPIQTYSYPDNEYYAGTDEYLFDAVKDINQKLDTLGPILKNLEWKWAGPGDSVEYAPESFILSVDGVDCEYCCNNCIYKNPTLQNHIQVGMFKDNSLGEDYFMLVNRWVGYIERPCEEVTIQKDRYSYLIDCLTGEVLDTLPPYGSFNTLIWPGEGKLFRLANFLKSTLSGSRQSYPQKINLSWTDPNLNESGYEVSRKLADGTNWFVLDSTATDSTSYSDTNLVGSETYNYRVRAFDEQYPSEYSNIATVKNFPNPPRNLIGMRNRICCPGFNGLGGGSGVGINGICPYCYTNEIILSWQVPLNQKANTLTQYKITATGPGLPGGSQSQLVSAAYTTTIFCVPELGQSYSFTVRAIDYAGDQSIISNTVNITSGTTNNCGDDPINKIAVLPSSVIPEKFELSQNYPNPFNLETVIRYALPEESNVKLVIYNLLGQKVRVLVDENQSPAYYTVSWDGKDDNGNSLSSGIYFYKISTNKNSEVKKLILVK